MKLRVVTVDHYQSKPVNGLDDLYSQMRGSDVPNTVPVIRIFGVTEGSEGQGLSTCSRGLPVYQRPSRWRAVRGQGFFLQLSDPSRAGIEESALAAFRGEHNLALETAKEAVHEMISKSEAMKKTRAILELYTNNVFTALELLKDSEAKLALTNIMLSLNPE